MQFSVRRSRIKRESTRAWLAADGTATKPAAGKRRERRRGVWQPRFGEHTSEDDDGYDRHFDLLHDNPVQHGVVQRVCDWPRAGVSPPGWGGGSVAALSAEM